MYNEACDSLASEFGSRKDSLEVGTHFLEKNCKFAEFKVVMNKLNKTKFAPNHRDSIKSL